MPHTLLPTAKEFKQLPTWPSSYARQAHFQRKLCRGLQAVYIAVRVMQTNGLKFHRKHSSWVPGFNPLAVEFKSHTLSRMAKLNWQRTFEFSAPLVGTCWSLLLPGEAVKRDLEGSSAILL